MNERIPSSPPKIKAVEPNVARPRWSVMVPTYNCSQYLVTTLKNLLPQALPDDEMQIVVVDDASTDTDVEALVKEIGEGRIGYHRQKQNVGSLRNFETCLNLAKGHFVHILHGDDYVKDGFYKEIDSLFTQYPEAGAAITESCYIDENNAELWNRPKIDAEKGILANWLERIGQNQLVQTPSVVVKREVYEKLGGFFGMHYGEDWEMWIRIAAHYPVAYTPKILACYRIHNNNISSQYFLKGQSIVDIAKVISTVKSYFPVQIREKVNQLARRNFSQYFAQMTDRVYHNYNSPKAALLIAKEAFKMQKNVYTLYYLSKVRFKLLISYKLGASPSKT